MKLAIVFAAVFAIALARPQGQQDRDAVVLRQDSDNIGIDRYSYGYETSNGIQAQEQGELKQISKDEDGIAVRGSFSYVGPDGVTYTITYIADENGFQPQGAHIPQAPQ